MRCGYVIYDSSDNAYLALRSGPELHWVSDPADAWTFWLSWEADKARDEYGFFWCEVRLIDRRRESITATAEPPVTLTPSELAK